MLKNIFLGAVGNDHTSESTIDSEGFKGGTRGAPIMPRDAVSRTANVERNGRHKWDDKLFNKDSYAKPFRAASPESSEV